MRKALVALGVLAMVTAAVPASASTQISDPKEISANGTVQFGKTVTHNVAGYSSSSTDLLLLDTHDNHRIGIYASSHDIVNLIDLKFHVNGEDKGYVRPGWNYVDVRGSYATIEYFSKSTLTKSFNVTYYKQ
ncbi:hypothetical protein SMD22_06680 [Brevibacillus halotolerans]|uniref:hypothetical protein n=1 Tax=Brevibacillus TaxID=55080 RepID=UPI00215B9569|nr:MULTISPECIES: hypothetical protein [Brevibacillus]MCR8961681.1 hypothetical protein [Brevibacillus laterosporus]MCZ0833836.1 hypothetical protein [Brevibacillus halotolerans]WPS88633.1 hypothetical protein SMD22_06680 [Brevibacillus halotolerans]